MTVNLVIVESPAKAKTIKKYLGADFQVQASYGHVRDLRPKEGSVDPEHDFFMTYELIEKNKKHVDEIVKLMKKADALYLATDPDREGEAIAWHIQHVLQEKKVLKNKPVHRVVFHEITQTAVRAAMAHPRDIAKDLVNAQQARRALDYLVGFNLSPVLWKKIRYGLSAGRAQSPALRMIVEREQEIEKFISQEYWTIRADCFHDKKPFPARLIQFEGNKVEQFSIVTEEAAKHACEVLLQQAKGILHVTRVEKKQRKRHPAAPFITSTLQQEAARKLGYAVSKTMRLAQQLYEGIDIDSGLTGLITYMRTDSVHLADEAIKELRMLINERYGSDHVPEEVRVYRTKAKNAQEAHEGIRPTSAFRSPEAMKSFLSNEQFKLYDLIWKRAVASQMISAVVDTTSVDLAVDNQHLFRANGTVLVIPGFIRVYQEGQDDVKEDADEDTILPALKEGDQVELRDIHSFQHFTEPPPRYSEASLIKSLEEHGIGRPSTYATIVSTLQTREYVVVDTKRFKPTDVGRVVSRFLTNYFTQYVDYGFTANLEDELDAISRGEKEWLQFLREFWDPFKHQVVLIQDTVKRTDVTQEQLDEACPKCAKPLSIRLGKRDQFIGCTGYPECDYTRPVHENAGDSAENGESVIADRTCPQCEGQLKIRSGPYGKFIGCLNYPKCKFIEPLNKPMDTQVECPECHQGSMIQRKSRWGKLFYSCSRYPDCKYAVWNQPVAEPCPTCAWPVLTIKTTKRRGTELVCPRKTCDFAKSMPMEE